MLVSQRRLRREESGEQTREGRVEVEIQVELDGAEIAATGEAAPRFHRTVVEPCTLIKHKASCVQAGKERFLPAHRKDLETVGNASRREVLGSRLRTSVRGRLRDGGQSRARRACNCWFGRSYAGRRSPLADAKRCAEPYQCRHRKTKRKPIGSSRTASISRAEPGATDQTLHERIDLGGVAKYQARTEQERVVFRVIPERAA